MESSTQSAESAALVADIDHPTPNGVWARAYETFGDEGKALHWMQTPRDIFGGYSPAQLVASGSVESQRQVMKVLIRIDYGVFS